MKAIILAGGFAVRLLPITKHIPKPLLPVAGKPVIDYLVEQLDSIAEIDSVIVSTNRYYESNFNYWLKTMPARSKPIKLVYEGTGIEKQKLGAIAALHYVIQMEHCETDELLVLAGDNIFEFNLQELVLCYHTIHQPVIAFCDLADRNKDELKQYGLGLIDENHKIIGFQEKPPVPASTFAATGCYLYPPFIQSLIRQYLEDKNNPDAPGYFIEWLYRKIPVHAFISRQSWFDIGSIDSYDYVNQYYKAKNGANKI